MQEIENTGLTLKGKIFGLAPVQATGTVNGFPFYFRARYDFWTFAISENEKVDPVDIQTFETGQKHGFFAEGQFGKEGEYEASYMDTDTARALIIQCTNSYLAQRS